MGFTGIVQAKGLVTKVEPTKAMTLWDGTQGEGHVLTIKSQAMMEDIYLGCSIATNGVCLTVTSFDKGNGEFQVRASTKMCLLISSQSSN
jgi:riboflavin synthase